MNEERLIEIEQKIEKDQGCLCYVWNNDHKNPNRKIMIIKIVNRKNSPAFFNDGWSCVHYHYAEPITNDIKKYII